MFGVAVDGSMPRCTSLYNTASKYPAKPVRNLECLNNSANSPLNAFYMKMAFKKGADIQNLIIKLMGAINCLPCTSADPVSEGS